MAPAARSRRGFYDGGKFKCEKLAAATLATRIGATYYGDAHDAYANGAALTGTNDHILCSWACGDSVLGFQYSRVSTAQLHNGITRLELRASSTARVVLQALIIRCLCSIFSMILFFVHVPKGIVTHGILVLTGIIPRNPASLAIVPFETVVWMASLAFHDCLWQWVLLRSFFRRFSILPL